jgi:hypothetical protein
VSVRSATAAALLLLATACARGGEIAAPAVAPDVEAGQEPPSAMKPMKKVEIVVGGCRETCRDPASAVAGFLEATAGTDLAKVAKFVDTTRLVLDGDEAGARWARLWNELRQATRADEVREASGSLSSWTRGLSPDQVRQAVTAGPRPVKVWSTEAIYEFVPPGAPAIWTLTLRPRGLEWLVTEVRRAPGPTR